MLVNVLTHRSYRFHPRRVHPQWNLCLVVTWPIQSEVQRSPAPRHVRPDLREHNNCVLGYCSCHTDILKSTRDQSSVTNLQLCAQAEARVRRPKPITLYLIKSSLSENL